ncbi:GtrA family protein [Salmonella enterica subsp. enterica serovar Indiana]|nr:GtrA family protein [Salmonella enterica subsp. enterica serovar Indiana]MDR5325514.1 GtrA family protein [Salmonella enterica subsp. enterica serovar Indiana]
MPAFEWVHVQLHQQKGMISLSPPTICNSASGFVIAVSFSFYANARFTFNASTTTLRYMMYVGFMGTLSAVVGWMADQCSLPPLVTLITFSAISLVCGFIYSRFIIFRDKNENLSCRPGF